MRQGLSFPTLSVFWLIGGLTFFSDVFPAVMARADQLGIGVPTALTGDAVEFGVDIKNALTLANDTLGGGRYRLIFEDEKCSNKDAVSVANKLVHVDKIQYALGFPCNSTLLATASIYERAKVTVVTASATSGDVLDVGKHIFRLFPSDTGCAAALYKDIAKRHKQLAVLSEQNEYPVLMERSINKQNEASPNKISIESFSYSHGQTDLRTLALKVRTAEAIFVNANTDPSFIAVMKQLREQQVRGAIFSAYFGSSASIRTSLGDHVNGVRFCSLPPAEDLISEKAKGLFDEFKKRYGEPKSGFPVVPTALESFRILDEAIRSGVPAPEFLRSRRVENGFLPPYFFDEHGAVQGIDFQMFEVQNGKVSVVQ